MLMKSTAAALLGAALLSSTALAQAVIVSPNGFVQIGVNRTGELNAVDATSGVLAGIGYNFGGGFRDALTPGCLCESWGVAGNGAGSQVGQATGNQGISAVSDTLAAGTYTTVTTGAAGLTVTQIVSIGTQTATGALFEAEVTIANNTGATVTDVRYARAMDWDVPPTEFNEWVTHKGVPTTTTLLHATNDGFANANPMTATGNGGLAGTPPNTEGSQGRDDHGSLFVFGFGELADGASKTFSIFYGAGANLADALALLGQIGPELYSLGQSSLFSEESDDGAANDDAPTFVFAFGGVGGVIVVPPPPPPGVPAPAALGVFGLGLLGLAAARRRRA